MATELWPRNVDLRRSFKTVPSAYNQGPISFSLMTWCFNCLNRSCTKHGRRLMRPSNVDVNIQLTLDAIKLIGRLPAELKLEVADKIGVRTHLSLRHAEIPPELGDPWADSERRRIQRLFRRFDDELVVFPAVAPQNSTTIRGGNIYGEGKISPSQHLLFLEIINRNTTAMIDFFTERLRLDHKRLSSQRPIILHLWRIFLVPPMTPTDGTVRMNEVFTYFHSLSRPVRQQILDFIREIGRAFASVHPIENPMLAALNEALQQQMIAHCTTYFAIEWLRVGMSELWRRVHTGSHKTPNVAAAFSRPASIYQPGWTPVGYPSYVGWKIIDIDAWTYRISLPPGTDIHLLPPKGQFHDFYKALLYASDRPETGQPLSWAQWLRNHNGVLSWHLQNPEQNL